MNHNRVYQAKSMQLK